MFNEKKPFKTKNKIEIIKSLLKSDKLLFNEISQKANAVETKPLNFLKGR